MQRLKKLHSGSAPSILLLCTTFFGQAPAGLDTENSAQKPAANIVPAAGQNGDTEIKGVEVPAPSTLTLPVGTRVLMRLASPLHTTSAVPGSGVYLETVAPVVQADHVVIPARTQVLGTVEEARRPGRVKGRAQLRLHFTTLVFANNYVASIDGTLQSVPGNHAVRSQDTQGTIEPVDQIDRDVATLAGSTAAGFVVGSLRGGRIRATKYSAIGAGVGAGGALAEILFARGDDIRLDRGALVEMMLRQPLSVEVQRVPTSSTSSPQSSYALPEPKQSSAPSEQSGRSYPAPHRARPMLPILPWPFRGLDLWR